MDSSEVISIEIDIGESIKDIDDISKAMKEIENTSLELSKSIKSAFASLNQNLGALQVFCAKIPPRACGLVGMTRRVRSRIKPGKGNSMRLKRGADFSFVAVSFAGEDTYLQIMKGVDIIEIKGA